MEVLEAEGGAVSSLYPHCIPTVSLLYPSKERCLRSPAAAEGGGWRRRWGRVAEAAECGRGGGGRGRPPPPPPHCIHTVSSLYPPEIGVLRGKRRKGGGGGGGGRGGGGVGR